MKILPISQPIKKVGKMMLPTIAAAAMLTACNAPKSHHHCQGCQQDSVEISRQDSIDANNDNLDDVEITEGLVKNRDPREIKKYTGLNEKEFETVVKIGQEWLNKRLQDEYGKYYYSGTEYDKIAIFPDEFYIRFTNGNKRDDESMQWMDSKKSFRFYLNLGLGDDRFEVKVVHEDNGDFSVITKEGTKTTVCNFNKDGKLKEEDYMPDESENSVAEIEQTANQSLTNIKSDVNGISFFNGNNKGAISKMVQALGFSSVEYSSKSNNQNVLFFNGPDYSYRLNVRKVDGDNDTMIGIANKVTSNGESEIYLIKGEMFSSNKTDKLILSKIRVVQDGLSDDAPVKNKNLTETRKTGGNKTRNSYNLNGEVRTPWLKNLFSFTNKKFYSGNISSEAVNEIDELVTNLNSDLKTIKIVSVDKKTGAVSVQGN